MADISFGRVPFVEQIAFFRRKLNVLTNSWLDVYAEQHDHAFMVAGANRDALLQDFRDAVDKIAARGETLEDFRRDFDAIVAKHGWDYNGGRNWRSRVIYETNLRTSYAAGRWQQLQQLKQDMPYWLYIHKDGEKHPRPLHQQWGDAKLVLHADDPWWHTHYPPNGWGCQCTVRALDARVLKKLGKDGPDTAPPIDMQQVTVGQRSPGGPRVVETPAGVDPGFGYAPGRRAWLDGFAPPFDPDGGAPIAARESWVRLIAMPAPRLVAAARLLSQTIAIDAAIDLFLREFGATRSTPAIFVDVVGERLPISEALFNQRSGSRKEAGKLEDRKTSLLLLADTIRDPDEIWLAWKVFKMIGGAEFWQLRRRYLRRVIVEGERGPRQGLVVFDLGRYGWNGTTAFNPVDDAYLQAQRTGERVYVRKTEGNR